MITDRSYRAVFARKVRQLQAEAPGDLPDLMNYMDVGRTTATYWLNGQKMPGLIRVVRLAGFFDLDPQRWLLEIADDSIRDGRLDRMGLPPGQDVLAAVLAHDLASNWNKDTGGNGAGAGEDAQSTGQPSQGRVSVRRSG